MSGYALLWVVAASLVVPVGFFGRALFSGIAERNVGSTAMVDSPALYANTQAMSGAAAKGAQSAGGRFRAAVRNVFAQAPVEPAIADAVWKDRLASLGRIVPADHTDWDTHTAQRTEHAEFASRLVSYWEQFPPPHVRVQILRRVRGFPEDLKGHTLVRLARVGKGDLRTWEDLEQIADSIGDVNVRAHTLASLAGIRGWDGVLWKKAWHANVAEPGRDRSVGLTVLAENDPPSKIWERIFDQFFQIDEAERYPLAQSLIAPAVRTGQSWRFLRASFSLRRVHRPDLFLKLAEARKSVPARRETHLMRAMWEIEQDASVEPYRATLIRLSKEEMPPELRLRLDSLIGRLEANLHGESTAVDTLMDPGDM